MIGKVHIQTGRKNHFMNIAVFSTKPYDRQFLDAANTSHNHTLDYFEPRLSLQTVPLAEGYDVVCAFVNDHLDADVLSHLHDHGTKLIALRSAGFNNVDLPKADELGLTVVRVPAYSPHAVAEHTIGLMLTLNRRINRAYNRVREGNFSLDGLMGYVLRGRTAGIIGTGQIGTATAEILLGMGCQVIAFDPYPNDELAHRGVTYVGLDELITQSDIITLHCPLTQESHHMIDAAAIDRMKPGVMLINTSRGALLDTPAVIEGLKSEKIGLLGLDVYEEEENLFFQDLSAQVIRDDVFARLLTFPNVLITGHQAFFTEEALTTIATTTLENISAFERGGDVPNTVTSARVVTG
jgi:D-lactate dehydrogenase